MASERLFVLYDGRARGGDTDNAAVLVSSESIEDAKVDDELFSDTDGVWYEYDVHDATCDNERRCDELNKLRNRFR